tara:strand:- start:626 stop:937 length:312 start_codon:yes stop_codon:yes gene_type:complete
LSDPEILLKAAINRITARITEKLINSAQDFSEIAEEIPKKVKEEWSNFKEEVIEETERLEKETNSSKEQSSNQPSTKKDLTQAQIDKLRSKVIEINKNIEERN